MQAFFSFEWYDMIILLFLQQRNYSAGSILQGAFACNCEGTEHYEITHKRGD